MEETRTVTLMGSPVTLAGKELKVGETPADAPLTGLDMKEVLPLSHAGTKAKMFVIVPSLDTPVCSIETKKFSEALKSFGDDVAVYTISPDLPFAQKRYCGAEGVDNMVMLSSYRSGEFGEKWGVQIKENALLARAVYVLDKNNSITYAELVPDISDEPNYEAALDALRDLTQNIA